MSARFAPYDDYQDSALDWLGRVPNHWELRRLGGFFKERREKVSDKNFPALSVTMQGIVPQLDDAAKTKDGDNRKLVRRGDFVINSRSDRKGSSGVSPLDGSVSLIAIVLEPDGLMPEYVHHLLRSEAFQEEFYRFGKGIVADLWSTNYAAMKNITIPVTSAEEQKQIAAFLDYETAKIDTLIEKQQQLIALLGEKRQAVISHAVTKGLNPDVPMRDSGVEWLGEVPAHWSIARVKYVSHRISKGDTPSNFGMDFAVDGPVRFIKIENIGSGELIDEPRTSISYLAHNQIKRSHLQVNDIVFAIAGATTGKCAIIREKHLPANTNQAVAYVRPNCRVFPKFLVVWLQNQQLQEAMWEMTSQSAQPNLSMENLGNLPVVVPPIDEQTKIAAHAYTKTKNFDLLEAKASNAVELLQERRTALISAAVTGKIDVRGWKRPSCDGEHETDREVA